MKNFKLISMAVSAFLFVTASVSCGKSDEVITDSSPVAESTQAVTVASETTTTTVTEQSTVATTAQTTTVLTTAQVTTTVVQPVDEEGETSESDTDEVIIRSDENDPFHFVVEGDITIIEETTPSGDFGENRSEESNNNTGSIENYDTEAYEKLGIKVILSGSNAEQAQQYYDACVAAYPNLPWGHSGSDVGVDTSDLIIETRENFYGRVDEVDAIIESILNGRDYHDLSIEELYSIIGYCGTSYNEYYRGIVSYFMDLTSKRFTSGGYSAL